MDTSAELVMWADNPIALSEILQRYVPISVLPFVGELEERWASEIRKITVVFAHISFDFDVDDESTENLERLQKVQPFDSENLYFANRRTGNGDGPAICILKWRRRQQVSVRRQGDVRFGRIRFAASGASKRFFAWCIGGKKHLHGVAEAQRICELRCYHRLCLLRRNRRQYATRVLSARRCSQHFCTVCCRIVWRNVLSN